MVETPAGVDPVQLLWALAGNESSYGANCTPRHEPGYCYITHGRYATTGQMRELTQEWGCLAHCSYGPWQLMLDNAHGAFSPLELMSDPEKACMATVSFLRRVVLPMSHSLDDIGHFYNAGPGGPFPTKYCCDLKLHYSNPMPTPPAPETTEAAHV